MDSLTPEPSETTARAPGRAKLAVLALALLLAAPLLLTSHAAGDGGEEGRGPGPSLEAERFTLAGGEVTLTRPANLALAVTAEQLLDRSTIPACAEGFDYCFYLPAARAAGTNLSAAGVRVERLGGLGAEISCLLAQPAGRAGLQPGVVRAGSYSTARFGELGEGAAGSYSRGELYRLWTGAACYEFELRQVLTRFENYPSGAVTEFTAADQAELGEVLEGVVRSVSLAGGTVPEWPSGGSSHLEAFVRLDAPAAGEEVTSPLDLEGEAVGPWFFEGSFPVALVTPTGESLAASFVTAEGEWMTPGFVPFTGELGFEVKEPTEALLLLRRDNPSGLPEHDAAARIPLLLLPE